MQTPAALSVGQTRRVAGEPALFSGMAERRNRLSHCRCGDAPAQRDGLMHNRLRMITASLVKDLLIDWRLGSAYFMSQLFTICRQ